MVEFDFICIAFVTQGHPTWENKVNILSSYHMASRLGVVLQHAIKSIHH